MQSLSSGIRPFERCKEVGQALYGTAGFVRWDRAVSAVETPVYWIILLLVRLYRLPLKHAWSQWLWELQKMDAAWSLWQDRLYPCTLRARGLKPKRPLDSGNGPEYESWLCMIEQSLSWIVHSRPSCPLHFCISFPNERIIISFLSWLLGTRMTIRGLTTCKGVGQDVSSCEARRRLEGSLNCYI